MGTEERLALLAAGAVVAARKPWDPTLHPRARNGRFIEVGGWIRALFNLGDGRQERLNGKVVGFQDLGRGYDPVVVADTKRGRLAVPVEIVEAAAPPKGRISEVIDKVIDRPKDFGPDVLDRPAKPKLTFEQRRAQMVERMNADAKALSVTDPSERAKGLNKMMGGLRGSPLSTAYQFNKRGKSHDEWDPERRAQHEALWDDFIAKVEAAEIPTDRKALALGGLPGSGKSSSLLPGEVASELGVVGWDTLGDPPEGVNHVVLNPDSVKAMMIDAGMLPDDISPLIKPNEQVSLIHAESNFLVSLFFERLAAEGYNTVYDTTMANVPHVKKNLGPLQDAGYTFTGLFADIDYPESRISAMKRYAEEWETPLGGRFVPSEAGSGGSSRGHKSANRDVFQDMTPWFTDGWLVVDNSGIADRAPLKQVTARGVGADPELAKRRAAYNRERAERIKLDEGFGRAEGSGGGRSAADFLQRRTFNPDDFGKPRGIQSDAGEPQRAWPGLVWGLRRGELTPEGVLEALRGDDVFVADPTLDEEDYTSASTLPHELAAAGGSDYLDDVAEEVERLRSLGQTVSALYVEPDTEPITAAAKLLDWDPALHPRGADGKFIRVNGWVRGIFRTLDGPNKGVGERYGKVKYLRHGDGNNAFVVIDHDGHEAIAHMSKVTTAAPPKADLSPNASALADQVAKSKADFYEKVLGGRTMADIGINERTQGKKPTDFVFEMEAHTTAIGKQVDAEVLARVDASGIKLLTPEQFDAEDSEITAAQKSLRDSAGEYGAKIRNQFASKMFDGQLFESLPVEQKQAVVSDALEFLKTDPTWQKFEITSSALLVRRDILDDNRRVYRAAYSKALREVLAEVIPDGLGGKIDYDYFDSGSGYDTVIHKNLVEQTAGAVYPSSWINASNKSPWGKMSIKLDGKRAQYRPDKGWLRTYPSDKANARQTMIHEFGHRLEDNVAGLKTLEYAFYWRRVGDEQRSWIGPGYGVNEVGREDKFATKYMGRDYGGHPNANWELFTVGSEHLLSDVVLKGTPGARVIHDADYRAWLIGTLVTLDGVEHPDVAGGQLPPPGVW